MGRFYTVIAPFSGVTTIQDLLEIQSASSKVTIVHEIVLSQTSELADAAEEQLHITINRGTLGATSGSGGAAVTPQPLEDGSPAFAGSCERNNTTLLAAVEKLHEFAWNLRAPLQIIFTPETRPVISPGCWLSVQLAAAPADSVTIIATVTIEELG